MKAILTAAFAGSVLVLVQEPNAMATPTTMNCAKAETMMLQAHSMVQGTPTMTGNVDKDFATMESQNSKAQVMMAQVEISCGKSAAEKDSASKLLKESQERLEMLREQGLRPELRS